MDNPLIKKYEELNSNSNPEKEKKKVVDVPKTSRRLSNEDMVNIRMLEQLLCDLKSGKAFFVSSDVKNNYNYYEPYRMGNYKYMDSDMPYQEPYIYTGMKIDVSIFKRYY